MRYKGYWKDRDNVSWYVNFGSLTETATEITLGSPACELEMVGKTDNIFKPVRYTGATVNIFTKGDYLMDLYARETTSIPVNIYKNNAVVFTGFVTPCIYSQEYKYANTMSIECVDALSVMENLDYQYINDTAGINTFLSILGQLFNVVGAYPYIAVDSTISVSGGKTGRLLEDLYVSEACFYDTDDEEFWKCKDVLENMIQYLNMTATLKGNILYITNNNSIISDGGLIYYVYTPNSTSHIYSYYESRTLSESARKRTITTDMYFGDSGKISLTELASKVTVKDSYDKVDTVIDDIFDEDHITILPPEGDTEHNYITFNVPVSTEWDKYEKDKCDQHLGSDGDDKKYYKAIWAFYTSDQYACHWYTAEAKTHEQSGLTYLMPVAYDMPDTVTLGTIAKDMTGGDWNGYYYSTGSSFENKVGAILVKHGCEEFDSDDDKTDWLKYKRDMDASPSTTNYLLMFHNNIWLHYNPRLPSLDTHHYELDYPVFETTQENNSLIIAQPNDENTKLYLIISGNICFMDRYHFYTKPSSYGRKDDDIQSNDQIKLKCILKIGDYYWNGSKWDTERSSFDVIFDIYDDAKHFIGQSIGVRQNYDWKNVYLGGTEGQAIPIEPTKMGAIEFKICYFNKPVDTTYRLEDVWLSNFKINVQVGKTYQFPDSVNDANDTDTEYEGEIYPNAVDEFSDVTFKICTYDNKYMSYSVVGYKDTDDVMNYVSTLYDSNLKVSDIPEKMLIKNVITEYFKPRIIAELPLHEYFDPTISFKWGDDHEFAGKDFALVNQKYNCSTGESTIKIVEVRNAGD